MDEQYSDDDDAAGEENDCGDDDTERKGPGLRPTARVKAVMDEDEKQGGTGENDSYSEGETEYEEEDDDEEESNAESEVPVQKKKRVKVGVNTILEPTQKKLSPPRSATRIVRVKNNRINGDKKRKKRGKKALANKDLEAARDRAQFDAENFDAAVETLCVCEARVAVNDVGPHSPRVAPFLYWATKPYTDAIAMLLERCKVSYILNQYSHLSTRPHQNTFLNLLLEALGPHASKIGPAAMKRIYGQQVKDAANAER